MNIKEDWKPIEGLEGYYISELGNMMGPQGLRKTSMVKNNSIGTKIRNKFRKLKALVWEAFKGKVPEGYYVHLIDGDMNNCELSNLELKKANNEQRFNQRDIGKRKEILDGYMKGDNKLVVEYLRLPEANIQAEIYHQLRVFKMRCILEYKVGDSRFDLALLNEDMAIVAIIEVKSYAIDKMPNIRTAQIKKYKKYGIPIHVIGRMKGIPGLVDRLSRKYPEAMMDAPMVIPSKYL